MMNTKGIPRYVQAREELTDRIRSGDLQSGQKLPPEKEMAEQFGVSRMTIRKSLDDLVHAGLIYRRHGVGTFVSQSAFERNHTHLTDFFATCRAEGNTPKSVVLFKGGAIASDNCAKSLKIETGAQVIRITTLRSVDDVAITYHDAYLPEKYFPDLLKADNTTLNLDNQHTWQLIEQLGYNVANVVERLVAKIASPKIADLLNVEHGSPILYGERVLYSDEGIPLKYAECYNRGDRYSLSIILVK